VFGVLVPMFMMFMPVLFILVVVMMFVSVLVSMRMFVVVFVTMLVLVVPFAMPALFVLVVRVRRAFVDAELHAFHLLPLLAVEVHVEIAEVELRELPFERGRFHAEIDEGAHGHVAGDAGKAIEEKDFHREGSRKNYHGFRGWHGWKKVPSVKSV
jgi:hypothetical protein